MAIAPLGRPEAATITAIFEPISGRGRLGAPIRDGDARGVGSVLGTLFTSLAPMRFGEIGAFGVGGRFDSRS